MTPEKARKTNLIMLILFIVALGVLTAIGMTSCATTQPSGFEQAQVTSAHKSYGFVEYSTISMMTKKKDRDRDCPAVTNLYCKLSECDNDPVIIKLCGYYKINNGSEVFVYSPLRTGYWDHNRYVIIEGYKYTMLE